MAALICDRRWQGEEHKTNYKTCEEIGDAFIDEFFPSLIAASLWARVQEEEDIAKPAPADIIMKRCLLEGWCREGLTDGFSACLQIPESGVSIVIDSLTIDLIWNVSVGCMLNWVIPGVTTAYYTEKDSKAHLKRGPAVL